MKSSLGGGNATRDDGRANWRLMEESKIRAAGRVLTCRWATAGGLVNDASLGLLLTS